ncbi:MAG TPA: NAD(P)-dependent oxidoreductase [Dongiaceae bacterium]|nr:NAD(P)-dependent oxidoreductase [Dongiaceae bacterium]
MTNEILVTGASGFLGRHLVSALESQGYSVRSHSSRDGDIASCPLPMEGVRHVFHLAAKSFVPESWTNPQAFYSVNVMGTVNVLEHCRRHRASVTLISSYVYGQPKRLPVAEDHPLAALNPYAHTKLLSEDLGRFYEQHHGVRLVVVRPFNIYGPGQTPPFLVPLIIEQALDPQTSTIRLKDLRPRRDYLYVDDAIRFLSKTVADDVKGTYNLGSGQSASVAEVAQLVIKAAGCDKGVVSDDQPRPQEVLDVRADISRAANELGWHPSISLQEGIARVVAAQRAKA